MENNSFDEILTQFARRETAGYIVWGQKLKYAHNEEVSNLRKEAVASNEFNDALSKQLKVLADENARLRAALKPVLECRVVGWNIEDGDELPRLDLLANCHNAVREAQRIYSESEAK